MAKVKSDILKSLAGTLGSGQFRTRRNGVIELSAKHRPTNPQTPPQQTIRALYSAAVDFWHSLTTAEQTEYTDDTGALPTYQNFMRQTLEAGELPMQIHDDTQHKGSAKRNAAGGLAPLDINSLIPFANIPPLKVLQNIYPNYSTHAPTENALEEFHADGAGIVTAQEHVAKLSLGTTATATASYNFTTHVHRTPEQCLIMSALILIQKTTPTTLADLDIGFMTYPHVGGGGASYEGIFMRNEISTNTRKIVIGNDDDDDQFSIESHPEDTEYHIISCIINTENISFYTDGTLDTQIQLTDCDYLPSPTAPLYPAVRMSTPMQQTYQQNALVDYMGYSLSPV